MNDNHLLWIWIKLAVMDRPQKVYKLYSEFGNAYDIYKASKEDYANLDFLSEDDVASLSNKNLDKAKHIVRLCETNLISAVSIEENHYPALLKTIHTPPCLLFYFGNYGNAISKPCFTIVGTRDCTTYGEIVTANFSSALAKGGFTIVCGVAKGIDSIAIDSAIKANGSVISVLPNGMFEAKFNVKFKFKNIQYNGAVISEYLPDTPVLKHSYYERNRILSGISVGTLITQAPEKSGALITASYALDEGRDVFAIPSNIDIIQSTGSNKLIRDGANVALSYDDIFNFYESEFKDQIKPIKALKLDYSYEDDKVTDNIKKVAEFKRDLMPHLSESEQQVFEIFSVDKVSFNDIVIRTKCNIVDINVALSSLEAKGAIKSYPGGYYKIQI